MQTPKYFRLEEFLSSSTARQRSIENIPSWEIVEHLLELAYFLDDLREDWGSGIKVTSGFRNEDLNSAVGGVETSSHKIGYAADIVPSNGRFDAFVGFLKIWLKDKGFDQCLIEENKRKGTRWVHFGLRNRKGEQRRQIFNLSV